MSDHGFSTSAFLAALALAGAAACSPPSPYATTSDADLSAGAGNAKAKAKTNDAETSHPTSKTDVPATATCAAKATQNDCAKCCGGDHGDRVAGGMQALAECVCNAARTTCGDACDQDYCSGAKGATSSGSCGCIPDLSACVAVAKQACDGDPGCAAATKCNVDAKCDGKPGG
jgi:hypothetical protein